jgi:hypothetical protein
VKWSHFFWTQVEGPAVQIDDPSAPSIRILVPAGADRLGFLFVASSRDLVRVFRLTVPIQQGRSGSPPGTDPRHSGSSGGTAPAGGVRADAGDDQIGLVGHRVTLNGTRSEPAGVGSSRWIQVGGPAMVAPEQQGLYYSFIPGATGIYRFALLVSAQDKISEPDEVSVVVGTPPGATPPGGVAPPYSASPFAAPNWPGSLDQTLSAVLPQLPGSPRIAGEVAEILEAISQRYSLYSSFGELQSEMSRRLDAVVPKDPSQRSWWIQNVFLPLTAITSNELLASGVDIRIPAGVQQALTPAQQERIRDHLQRMAKAFRTFAASH